MAIVLSLLASLMWGAADFAGGLLSRRRPALTIVGWSAGFGAAMASLAVAVSGGWHGPFAWVPWGMAAGATGALGLISYYVALATGTMGVVAPVASLGVAVPVVVGIVAGESPSSITIGGIAVTMAGIVLTSGPEFAGGSPVRPVFIGALAGLFFGLFFVCMDRGAEDSPLLTLWAMRVTVTAAFLVAALARGTTGGAARARLHVRGGHLGWRPRCEPGFRRRLHARLRQYHQRAELLVPRGHGAPGQSGTEGAPPAGPDSRCRRHHARGHPHLGRVTRRPGAAQRPGLDSVTACFSVTAISVLSLV